MSEQTIAVGLDIGSRTIKRVSYDGETFHHQKVVENTHNTMDIVKQLLKNIDYSALIATGYGRSLVEVECNAPTVSEIKAFAKGCSLEFSGEKTILDIGGQDTKVIRVNNQGNVVKFEMNDRCAAGTGKFFEIMANTLEYSLEEFSETRYQTQGNVKVNSLCTVFAESEVISLVAKGVAREEIAYALHESVVHKILPLVERIHKGDALVFCGGCAKNHLLHQLFETHLHQKVIIPQHPQIMGAYGAAMFAYEHR